ncbi:MAG: beta-galactosidase [Arachidicoccus sp.]|nr:beta-galactosidase [Arachidicoccus sp.]
MKKLFLNKIALATAIFISLFSNGFAQSNDHIFPAAAAAKPYINFDSRGFIIKGKRTFLASAGLEYARIPHELWHDRLLRLKRAGFDCIEIYTFWNFHEPEEGKFDFSGDHDLNAFLQEVHKLDMYAIVRVGPYYCAEWDLGGYPHWLKFKPGVVVRSPNAEFEKYVDRFFAKLIPIVAKNQINHGGAVVLVQLENEHPLSWGTYIPNEYFEHLQKTALSLGLEVPYFFSGLNHGSDPAGKKMNLDDSARPNPWFTTEFWSVWYNLYGSTQRDADEYGNRTWKIISHGGNGYNYYMAHGGTNFGYTNGHEDAASYDYGAAVGQTGDLRPIYYQFKRNALFARSFQDILENSIGTDSLSGDFAINKSVITNTRASNAGDIIFLENPDSINTITQVKINNQLLPSNGTLILNRWEFIPIIHNFSLTKNVSINWAVTRILGIQQEGNTKTIVVYGQSNSAGEIWFSVNGNAIVKEGNNAFEKENNILKLKWSFHAKKPIEYSFKDDNITIRVLTLNAELSDHTWFIDENRLNKIIVGPQYIGDIQMAEKHLQFETEQFWNRGDIEKQVWVYGDKATVNLQNIFPAINHTAELSLSTWQAKDASAPAQPGFDDSKWLTNQNPLEMGADGDLSEDAWYRTNFDVDSTGEYKLNIEKGGNRFIVFVDGEKVTAGGLKNLSFVTTAGHHQLTIYTAHDGRDKLYNFTRELAKANPKGIAGKITLDGNKEFKLLNWKLKGGPGEFASTDGWKSVSSSDTFDRPTFFKNYFEMKNSNSNEHPIWRVTIDGLSHGFIWVNGHNLGAFPETVPINSLYIPEAWLKEGSNEVVIYDEYGAKPDDVKIQAEQASSRNINEIYLK